MSWRGEDQPVGGSLSQEAGEDQPVGGSLSQAAVLKEAGAVTQLVEHWMACMEPWVPSPAQHKMDVPAFPALEVEAGGSDQELKVSPGYLKIVPGLGTWLSS